MDVETATVSQSTPAQSSREFKLSCAERSMKDAQDLVHALENNLGWTELALRRQSGNLNNLSAMRLVGTCRYLTQLLAGAVEIARRDACVVVPELRETPLVDLALAITHHLRHRFVTVETDLLATDCFGISVCHDPHITLSVVDRILEVFDENAADTAVWKVQTGLRGVNAAIMIQCEHAESGVAKRLRDGASSSEPLRSAGQEVAFEENLAICSALLARQGAALDVEVHILGGFDLVIIWPAHMPHSRVDSNLPHAGTEVATGVDEVSSLAVEFDDADKERSRTMAIQSDRFGSVDVDARDIIRFPKGIIGFADEREFVLIRTSNATAVGWLQSMTNPCVALPVVSAHVLAPPYPDVDIESYAQTVGLGTNLEELAVLVVLNAQSGVPATVNLVAPIIVNATTRVGAQVLLEGTRFTTREIFILPSKPDIAANESGQAAMGVAE